MLRQVVDADFLKNETRPVTIVPIFSGRNFHSAIHKICAVFFFVPDGEPFVLGMGHNDTPLEFSMSQLNTILEGVAPGSLMHRKIDAMRLGVNAHPNIIDIDTGRFLNLVEPTKYDIDLGDSHWVIQNYRRFHHPYSITPILILLEYAQRVAEDQEGIPFGDSTFWNSELPEILVFTERAGLEIDPDILRSHIGRPWIVDNRVYSRYNPLTTTGRFSNSFHRINFAALDKKTGVRKSFVSRFQDGMLLMYDFEAFHLKILGNLLDEPYISHRVIAEEMFSTTDITDEMYSEAKKTVFQFMYQNMNKYPRTARHTEFGELRKFFKNVEKLKMDLFDTYRQQGYTDVRGRKMVLDKPMAHKVFNYWMQSQETLELYEALRRIKPLIESRKTEVILHTYDSILFDVPPDELSEMMATLPGLISDNGRFPVKKYAGLNYHNMTAEQSLEFA